MDRCLRSPVLGSVSAGLSRCSFSLPNRIFNRRSTCAERAAGVRAAKPRPDRVKQPARADTPAAQCKMLTCPLSAVLGLEALKH